MTRWLVLVPEGDEVKYVRSSVGGDRLLVCDLDAFAKKIDAPLGPDHLPILGLPIYDADIAP